MVLAMQATGCNGLAQPPANGVASPTSAPAVATSTPAPPEPDDAAPTMLAPPLPSSPANAGAERTPAASIELSVLHVRIPRNQREAAEKVWNHLREDFLDSEKMLGLHRNGLRVGVGRELSWDAIKAALDALAGFQSSPLRSLRLPAGLPLGLELDTEPREQTLFFVESDGILTGSTWPQSRNVLRVTYVIHPQQVQRTYLRIVPEVRQRLDGWQWVRTEAGMWQTPKYDGRAFPAAGFSAGLEAGEFLLIAPGKRADVFGLIGGVFLCWRENDQNYDSYFFLRPEAAHGGQRN